MFATKLGLLAAGSSDKENLYPHATELIVGAVAFAIIFFFFWKWVLPRVNTLLEERREKIQGEMERAEASRVAADDELARYKTQLAGAADEANRIIDEARKTADQLRADLQAAPSRSRTRSWPAPRRRSVPNATGCSRSSGRRWARSPSSSPARSSGSRSTRPRTLG